MKAIINRKEKKYKKFELMELKNLHKECMKKICSINLSGVVSVHDNEKLVSELYDTKRRLEVEMRSHEENQDED